MKEYERAFVFHKCLGELTGMTLHVPHAF